MFYETWITARSKNPIKGKMHVGHNILRNSLESIDEEK